MSEEKLLQMFLIMCYYEPYQTMAIAVPKRIEAKELMQRLAALNESVPTWVRPTLRYKNTTELEFDNGSSISILHSQLQGCGRSLSWVALSQRLENLREWLECVSPCVAGDQNRVIYFS
jgi:hypothetical protein